MKKSETNQKLSKKILQFAQIDLIRVNRKSGPTKMLKFQKATQITYTQGSFKSIKHFICQVKTSF